MKTFEGFKSIEITIKDGEVILRQEQHGYSYDYIRFPVSQWGHLAAAISAEVMNPTPEVVEVAA